MIRKAYDTDLNDQEWAKIEPYFSKHRTYKWPKRVLVNETLYVTKTGCQWRMLPHDFPLYLTVWSFFRVLWRQDGSKSMVNGTMPIVQVP